MKRNFICIIVGIMVAIIGVYPVFAQQGSGNEKTVSRPQGPTPRIEVPTAPSTPVGIPPTLIDVRYRRCPIDGTRANPKYSAIYEGKVYRFCCDQCIGKFWENPQSVILKLKNTKEVPLTITNKDGKCPGEEKPASREFFGVHGDTITFYCSSECRGKDRGNRHRTSVSRQQIP